MILVLAASSKTQTTLTPESTPEKRKESSSEAGLNEQARIGTIGINRRKEKRAKNPQSIFCSMQASAQRPDRLRWKKKAAPIGSSLSMRCVQA
jgi:hypothetical protein